MKRKELIVLLNRNEPTEVPSFNKYLLTPKTRKVRKLSSTSNNSTTEVTIATNISNKVENTELQSPKKFRSPSTSSSEPVPSKRIKIISNILLRARQEDTESESNFIVERVNTQTPCESFNTEEIEARKKIATPKHNVLREVNEIYITRATDCCEKIKKTEVNRGDIPSQSHFSGTRVEPELKTLFKYSYFLFEKLLSPNTTKNEIRTVFKHSYFMFTNALTIEGTTEAYRDLLEICEVLKKYSN